VCSGRHYNVVPLGALVTISGGYHHIRGDNVLRACSGMDRASPGGRMALPTPHQTHADQRPASTSVHPLTQEVCQPWRALPHKIRSGTAIEGNRRHTPAGTTLPPGSVPLQGIPIMVHEHMATHRSPSSPCLSCSWPTKSHQRACPILGEASTMRKIWVNGNQVICYHSLPAAMAAAPWRAVTCLVTRPPGGPRPRYPAVGTGGRSDTSGSASRPR
jgi:hypothetical protein